MYARGEIKYSAPPRQAPPGHSAVALCAGTTCDENEYDNEGNSMEYDDNNYALQATVGGEDLCWNCYGVGHRKLGPDRKPICPVPHHASRGT